MDLTALVDALLRGASAALAGLLAARSWRAARPPQPVHRLAAALALGIAVQAVAGHPLLEGNLPRPLVGLLVGVALGNAALFAGLSWSLFQPERGAGRLLPPAWAAAVALGSLNVLLGHSGRADLAAQLCWALQRTLPAAAALFALGLTLRGWRGDLLEPRRRLRLGLLLGGAGYSLLQLGLRLGERSGRLFGGQALLDSLALLTLLLLLAPTLLPRGLAIDWLHAADEPAEPPSPAAASPATEAPVDPEDRLVAKRLSAALEQGIHRQGDLSIHGLEQHLRCPEYRLRRVIREQLGHGHFNQFLHQHRIADAQAALADPAQRQSSVLSIALACGYQSIGPFNRAFKASTGLTPTAWRQQRLADS